ncbi:MAG: cbb3-type cytochrome c oxidase subunit II [Cyanobacteria bacterium P01_H01_bin.74]
MPQRLLNYLVAAVFVALIFLTIIFVTAILPATTFQPEPTAAAHQYLADTPVARGREIYKREGCVYCHTQFVRYQDREMGEMVEAGDYVYETPHLLGTERTGPDLSNEGGKFPDDWQRAHLMQPRSVKPGSIMPSFSYLKPEEIDDLVAYIQSLGVRRELAARVRDKSHYDESGNEHGPSMEKLTWLEAPQEMRDEWQRIAKNVDTNNSAIANSGRGIYMQNCAVCHGVTGRGNGPASSSMIKKPANLTRPFYGAYTDALFYWRLKEGVAGSRMPRWGRTMSEQQLAYLVAFIKTLPASNSEIVGNIEVVNYSQLDQPEMLEKNYKEIQHLTELHESSPYVYGGGRH